MFNSNSLQDCDDVDKNIEFINKNYNIQISSIPNYSYYTVSLRLNYPNENDYLSQYNNIIVSSYMLIIDFKTYYNIDVSISMCNNEKMTNTLNGIKNSKLYIDRLIIYNRNKDNSINDILNIFQDISVLDFGSFNTNEEINVKLNNLSKLYAPNSSVLPNDMNYYFPKLKKLNIRINDNNDLINLSKKHISTLTKLDITNSHMLGNEYYQLDIKNLLNNNIIDITINLESNIILDLKYYEPYFKNLISLDIHHCHIKNIESINNLQNLKFLVLRNIKPPQSDFNLSLSLNNLTSLKIYTIITTKLFNTITLNLPNIKEVDITGCISEPIFNSCEKLTNLELKYNKYKSLSSKLFLSLPNLESLNCSNNLIEKISSSISNCKSLHTLNINNNNIKILPPHLESLHTLRCDNNNLLTIDNIIFKNIEDLSLTGNSNMKKIRLHPKCDLHNLRSINCTTNYITEIQKNIQHLIINYNNEEYNEDKIYEEEENEDK